MQTQLAIDRTRFIICESLREREGEREREGGRERERVLALPLTARELGGFSAYMYVKESASSTLES